MNNQKFDAHLTEIIQSFKEKGLYKEEASFVTAQGPFVKTKTNSFYNLCANNYLNLANDPRLIASARNALDNYGFGMASVRFICGRQDIHVSLEHSIAEFLKKEAAILYSSCFDANTGLFETLFHANDCIISDELNHASIIDGIRLCKAKRYRYKNNDMTSLESRLQEAENITGFKVIVTDGVFSMDGTFAKLPEICALAEKYNALVIVDDSHAVGFVGANGRGTAEYFDVMDKIDIYTGTLGKALGGASGGYVCGNSLVVDLLRQASRPYLFSNSLMPAIVNASITSFELMPELDRERSVLFDNTLFFRSALKDLGFSVIEGSHPIIPILLFDALLSKQFADLLNQEGVYVKSFSFPVVPKDKARIRLQMNAGFSRQDLNIILAVFEKVGRSLEIIK